MIRRLALSALNFLALLLTSVGVFWACAHLYSRNIDFPAELHPDEPGKIDQLMSDGRNYYHPQLMLEATLLLTQHEKTDMTDRAAVLSAGRRTSGYFSAGAVVLFMLAGYAAAGWPGAVLTAISVGLCPPLLAHSRYLKEEPALVFGIAAVVAAAAGMARLRKAQGLLLMAALVGVGVGLAASGKYVGLVMAVPGVVIVAATTWRRWWLAPLALPLMLAAGGETWRVVNYRAVNNWADFQEGFNYERSHALEDSRSLTMNKPNRYFVDITWDDAMPHVKALTIASPLALLLMRRRADARRVRELPDQRPVPYHRRRVWPGPPVLFGWWLIFTIVLYTVSLSYSVIPFFRYAVPLSVMLHALCGLGVVWVARWLARPKLPAVAIGGVLAVVMGVWQYDRCLDFDRQFTKEGDSRYTVRQWAKQNLPPNVRVAADGYVANQINRRRNPDTPQPPIQGIFFAPDYGALRELPARGYRYVAVAGTSYERFLSPHTFGTEGNLQQFHDREAYYRELFAKYPIVWEQRAEHPMRTFTNPDIVVFRLGAKQNGLP